MAYKLTLQGNNDELQSILNAISNLPTAKDPVLQHKYVDPGMSPKFVVPDSGYDGLAQVEVGGDSNLIAENIKSGVSIFGVTGSFEGESGGATKDYQITVSAEDNKQFMLYTNDGQTFLYKPDGSGTLKTNPATITVKGPQMFYCRFYSNYDYVITASGCIQAIRKSEYSSGDVYIVGYIQGDGETGTITQTM